jgi:hypothetical protein
MHYNRIKKMKKLCRVNEAHKEIQTSSLVWDVAHSVIKC